LKFILILTPGIDDMTTFICIRFSCFNDQLLNNCCRICTDSVSCWPNWWTHGVFRSTDCWHIWRNQNSCISIW